MESATTELDDLIADQQRDDTDTIKSEFRNTIPIEELDDLLGVEPGGEIVSFEYMSRPRGSVLVGTAAWHGTYGGYTRRGCRCSPCTGANSDYRRKRRQNGSS